MRPRGIVAGGFVVDEAGSHAAPQSPERQGPRSKTDLPHECRRRRNGANIQRVILVRMDKVTCPSDGLAAWKGERRPGAGCRAGQVQIRISETRTRDGCKDLDAAKNSSTLQRIIYQDEYIQIMNKNARLRVLNPLRQSIELSMLFHPSHDCGVFQVW